MLGGLSLLALAAAAPAQAQDAPSGSYDGNEIIVTATKRDASLQDVPFSINAPTEQAIERANASTIEDLSRNVAGRTVQNLGPGQRQVSIRGVSAGQIAREQIGRAACRERVWQDADIPGGAGRFIKNHTHNNHAILSTIAI